MLEGFEAYFDTDIQDLSDIFLVPVLTSVYIYFMALRVWFLDS